ncbi:MAG: DUF2235 domain-containing protein [Immundisolibacteraceae bacterium]|nr:DUF2235 domain-containing protein [Immundisolibacteraceae bacterium]
MARLIFCFDGTCNDPEDAGDFFEDTSISNVLKLHLLLGGQLSGPNGGSENPDQRSFYYSGVGTRGGWLKQKFNAMFAPPHGDIEDILDEANENLREHFKQGDEIYIFGFSRGAAIARMFAAHIKKQKVNHLETVKFLGVFDTVAATKGSLDLNPNTFPSSGIVFENGDIGDYIEKVVHLLSIDERRIAFQPTLFSDNDRVTEVWFPGVHSDIGGGYWFDGLSDITLQFMIDQIDAHLNVLLDEEVDYPGLKIAGAQDAICIDDLHIQPLAHGKIHEQKRSGVKAKTLSPRFVRVDKDNMRSDKLPVIHHSVVKRFKSVAEYRPYALRGIKYDVMAGDGALDTNEGNHFVGIKGLAGVSAPVA